MWRWHRWCGPWRYQSRSLQNKKIRCIGRVGRALPSRVGLVRSLRTLHGFGAASTLAHSTSPTHPPAPLDAPGSTTSSASTAALLSGSAAAAASTPAAAALPAEVGGGVGGAAAAAAAPAAAAYLSSSAKYSGKPTAACSSCAHGAPKAQATEPGWRNKVGLTGKYRVSRGCSTARQALNTCVAPCHNPAAKHCTLFGPRALPGRWAWWAAAGSRRASAPAGPPPWPAPTPPEATAGRRPA